MPDDLSPLASALRDRYVLERELGRGGMACVYLARDLKHDRPVALKVLYPELTAALGAERFLREIRLTARLQHPHILTVLDSGEADGRLWYTMPYVEGESLRQRLDRERQLPLEDVSRISGNVLAALAYAHDREIVHRDIKPENILLASGEAVLADFGIARAISAAGGEHLTQTGMSLGTPLYMSPEQGSGDKRLDARSDIYSFGCTLYEMLAGEPPYIGQTAVGVLAKHALEPVPHLRTVRASAPEALERVVTKALAKQPADRFANASQFADALAAATARPEVTRTAPVAKLAPAPRWYRTAAALAIGIVLGLGLFLAWRRMPSTLTGSARPKVLAVLPFENLGDSAEGYFADGITDEVRTKLSKIDGLRVIARGSSNHYRRTAKRPQEIARELGVDYLLTGTIRWERVPSGVSRVRVIPELVDVSSGQAPQTRWGERYDAALTGVFDVQAEIAGKVASALDIALGESTRQELRTKPTANLAAYEAFLRGEAALSEGADDPVTLRRAISFYERAVALDSGLVAAWVQLALAHASLNHNTPSPSEAAAVRYAAEQAQALGPGEAAGQLALGEYYRSVEKDGRKGLAAFEAGLKREPDNVDLLSAAALAERSLGRWNAAVEHLTRAAALDPRSDLTAARTARTLMFLRRYPEAEAEWDRALALAPTNLSFFLNKAMVALGQGDLARAQAVVRSALAQLEPDVVLAHFSTSHDLYWVLNDDQQQRVLTLPPSAFDNHRGTWAIVRAQLHHLRGDHAVARAYADTAQLAYIEHIRGAPDDGQQHVIRGLALAYLGQKAEAIREGERGVSLMPVSRDTYFGTYVQHQLARIYLLLGEPEKALDQLEPLLRIPYYLSPGWLRIDPTFAPLRGNPRFEQLVAGRS